MRNVDQNLKQLSLRYLVDIPGILISHCLLTLTMLDYFLPKLKDAKIFENHLNPVMLVFIG